MNTCIKDLGEAGFRSDPAHSDSVKSDGRVKQTPTERPPPDRFNVIRLFWNNEAKRWMESVMSCNAECDRLQHRSSKP